MKSSKIGEVQDLLKRRSCLDVQLSHVLNRRIDVCINRVYQNDGLCALVQPVVLAEIERQIAAIDRDLGKLGVEVDQ